MILPGMTLHRPGKVHVSVSPTHIARTDNDTDVEQRVITGRIFLEQDLLWY